MSRRPGNKKSVLDQLRDVRARYATRVTVLERENQGEGLDHKILGPLSALGAGIDAVKSEPDYLEKEGTIGLCCVLNLSPTGYWYVNPAYKRDDESTIKYAQNLVNRGEARTGRRIVALCLSRVYIIYYYTYTI